MKPARLLTSKRLQSAVLGGASDELARLVDLVLPAVITVQGVTVALVGCSGSGFAIDVVGHAVTNHHVVEEMGDRLSALVHEGFEVSAEVVGTDPVTDLAVLHLDTPPTGWLTLRQSRPRLGELCLGLGSPLGELTESVSLGVVSGLDRTIPGPPGQWPIEHALQTDAAINPGNSGGPLVDMQGEVLGVNQSRFDAGAQNLGFAIPAETVRQVTGELIAHGEIRRAALGVSVAPGAIPHGQKRERRLVVLRVRGQDCPLREGDALVSVAGISVADKGDLFRALSRELIGRRTVIQVIRDGKMKKVTMVPGLLDLRA